MRHHRNLPPISLEFGVSFDRYLVIKQSHVVAFLDERSFERKAALEVPPEETIYNRDIDLFERTEGLPHPVRVDILVNGLVCRQAKPGC
jgi:hypothetical protein